jgi:hypothetical protein
MNSWDNLLVTALQAFSTGPFGCGTAQIITASIYVAKCVGLNCSLCNASPLSRFNVVYKQFF